MRPTALFAAAVAMTLTFSGPTPAHAEAGDPIFAANVIRTPDGVKVPDYPLQFLDGSTGALTDYAGEVLVVTLWQEDCPYCIKEMPVLNRLSGDMKGEGIRVVALGQDQQMSQITGFLERYELGDIDPVMDLEKINGTLFSLELFGRASIATPTSFIVDKQGKVIARIWGLVDWDGDAARGFLRSLVLDS